MRSLLFNKPVINSFIYPERHNILLPLPSVPDQIPLPHPSPAHTSKRTKKECRNYTNKEKTAYVALAEEKGYRRAARLKNIPWPIAKVWVEKRKEVQQVNDCAKLLPCMPLSNFSKEN